MLFVRLSCGANTVPHTFPPQNGRSKFVIHYNEIGARMQERLRRISFPNGLQNDVQRFSPGGWAKIQRPFPKERSFPDCQRANSVFSL